MTTHTRDEECTLDRDGICVDCHVFHGGAPCPDCGGRGFHREGCPEMKDNPPSAAYSP